MSRRWVLLVALGAVLVMGGCGRADEAALMARTARYVVRLTLDRAALGEREALVEIRDEEDRPVTAEEVTIVPVMPEMGHAMPAVRADPEPEAPGRYRARGTLFAMAGGWDVDVRVRVGERSETARFSLEVG
jgi:hypothetical protein